MENKDQATEWPATILCQGCGKPHTSMRRLGEFWHVNCWEDTRCLDRRRSNTGMFESPPDFSLLNIHSAENGFIVHYIEIPAGFEEREDKGPKTRLFKFDEKQELLRFIREKLGE